jgi:hypothetical protein
MKKNHLILAAGTLLVGLSLAPSLQAQQDTTRKQSTGEVATAPTYSTLIAALDATRDNLTKLAALPAVKPADVRLVNAAKLAEGKDAELKAALDRNAEAITELRAAIGKYDAIVNSLSASDHKLTAADAVAIHVGTDGVVHVFYNKPM